ncbi:MAG: hypothetical protein HOH95_14415 [Dehalococcoidia bacterium]|nr:hypothetical protein [Dehalococcoidia bacterium]
MTHKPWLIVLSLIAALAVGCGYTSSSAADASPAATDTSTATATTEVTATPEPTATPIVFHSIRETPERQLLIAATANTTELPAYRFESELTISRLATLPVNVPSVSFTITGAVDSIADRTELTFDFSDLIAALASGAGDEQAVGILEAIFGTEPLEFRHIDGIAYLSGPLIHALIDVPTNWISFPAELDQSARSIGSLSFGQFNSQQDILALLDQVYGVDEIGSEDLRGIATTHYSGVISLATLLTHLHPDELTQIEADLDITLAEHLGDTPLDIWIDDEGIIRRILLVTDFSNYGGVGRYTEEAVGAITLRHEIYDIGEAILIEYPPFYDITPVNDTFLEGAAALGSEAPAS